MVLTSHFLCGQEGEDAVKFANRVKALIARQGGLVDLSWFGITLFISIKSRLYAVTCLHCNRVCVCVCVGTVVLSEPK